MAEKKTATKKVATTKKATTEKVQAKKVATKASAATTATTKKTASKSTEAEFYINSYTAGFRAGDVYQALATSGKTMSLAEISKVANITREEALLGIGWLLKEGKIEGENVADLRLA